MWRREIDAAEKYNEPGRFTAFIGYEWTSMPNGNNLHRNVILKWEPVYEVTQMKGDGEAHPMLSPTDEFADFETWDKASFGPTPHQPEMLAKEYAREALKRGLAYEAKLGANPFKFGLIGSTDSHTASPPPRKTTFSARCHLWNRRPTLSASKK